MTHNHNLKTDDKPKIPLIFPAPEAAKREHKSLKEKLTFLDSVAIGTGFYLTGENAKYKSSITRYNKKYLGKFTIYKTEDGKFFAKRVS